MQNKIRTSILDSGVLAAWHDATPSQNPELLPEMVRRTDELPPRFAAYYIQLRALPRRARRALQRHWRLPLAGVALMLALGQSPALAAMIPVGGSCTLVNAITAANTDAATGGCPAGSGADTIVLLAGSTQTLTTVNNSTHGPTGLPVISSSITIEGQGSTIRRDSTAPDFRILAVGNTGSLTLQETTISGGVAGSFPGRYGGGVYNSGGTVTVTNSTISGNFTYSGGGGGVAIYGGGTVTVTNSTIAGNTARLNGGGGGVAIGGGGTVTVTNSTISGNTARFDGGGGVASFGSGTVTVTNSTISGNSAGFGGGGVASYGYGTVTVTRTLVAGNIAPTGPEVFNDVISGGTVLANDHNLFGFNGNSGVVGFTPGPTDIVPAAGVQLGNILNTVLAFNGGPTQTHALVPGSPAIDRGGPACTDTNGNPLLTDQRGKPRAIDGNGDGIARCDIGAFEFFPVVNNLVSLDPAPDTAFDPTAVPDAPAGTFTIGATFTNTSNRPLRFPFFTVTELSGENLLLNAEEGPQGVGATVTPNVGDQVLSPGETVQVDFVIGLQTSTPFTFFVDLFAEPLVSKSPTFRRRPNVTTK